MEEDKNICNPLPGPRRVQLRTTNDILIPFLLDPLSLLFKYNTNYNAHLFTPSALIFPLGIHLFNYLLEFNLFLITIPLLHLFLFTNLTTTLNISSSFAFYINTPLILVLHLGLPAWIFLSGCCALVS